MSRISVCTALLALCLMSQAPVCLAVSDGKALMLLTRTLEPPAGALAGWNDSSDPCNGDWAGVTCLNGNVVSINLSNKQIVGRLAPTWVPPSTLNSIDLSSNPQLCGQLPPSLRKLVVDSSSTSIGQECTLRGVQPLLVDPMPTAGQWVLVVFALLGMWGVAAAGVLALVSYLRRRAAMRLDLKLDLNAQSVLLPDEQRGFDSLKERKKEDGGAPSHDDAVLQQLQRELELESDGGARHTVAMVFATSLRSRRSLASSRNVSRNQITIKEQGSSSAVAAALQDGDRILPGAALRTSSRQIQQQLPPLPPVRREAAMDNADEVSTSSISRRTSQNVNAAWDHIDLGEQHKASQGPIARESSSGDLKAGAYAVIQLRRR